MKTVSLVMALACFILVSGSIAVSADVSVRRDRSNQPVTIKSNEMTADNKGKTAIFSGKVVAKQGDITIFSDRLIVNYSDKKGEVDKVEAIGNVRIIQLNRTGIASQAVYESREGRITLTGSPNPKVMQGSDSVSGKIITFYVDDEKSVITSDGDPNSRVEAVINQPARKGNPGGR